MNPLWSVAFLFTAVSLACFIAGIGAVIVKHEAKRSLPVAEHESVMEDLDALLDTGYPSWRLHQEGNKSWRYCQDLDCPRPHRDYQPFKAMTDD